MVIRLYCFLNQWFSTAYLKKNAPARKRARPLKLTCKDLIALRLSYLGAVHMSRASPANRADSILSPLMGA